MLFKTNMEPGAKKPLFVLVIEAYSRLLEVETAGDISGWFSSSWLDYPIFVFFVDVPPEVHVALEFKIIRVGVTWRFKEQKNDEKQKT